jgi:CheY-like chemotaxis protein
VPRILVADDNSNIHRTVTQALKEAGVEVVAVGNGEAAVRKVAEVKPDLVLADIFMPVRSGYEVCEFIKKDPRFSHVPVVLLVGAFDPFDEREAQRVQADAILKKPFVPPDSLLRTVTDLLAQAASRSAPAPAAAPVAKTDRPSTPAPANQTLAPEYMDAPPEEFAPAKARLAWDAKEQPVAFGTLLETPSGTETDDSVMTSQRDPNLGEPGFWAPKAQPESEQGASEEEGAPAESQTELSDEQPWSLDAGLEELPAQMEAVPEATQSEPLLELEESAPELPELVSPKQLTQTPVEPFEESTLELPELPPFELATPEDVAPRPTIASLSQPPVAKADAPPKTPEAAPDPLPDFKDFAWAKPSAPAAQALPHPESIPEAESESEEESIDAAPPGLATLAPFLANLTSAASARGTDAKDPFDFDAPPALPGDLQDNSSEPESAELVDASAASQLDQSVIEAIAQRVIERMQPEIIELVTRELLRPAVEALVQRELEKK